MGVESAPKFFKPCQVSEVAKQPVLDPCESDGGSNTDTGRTSERRRNLPLRVRGVSRSRPNPSGKQTTNRTSRPPREPKENIREEFVPMDSSGHTEDARRDKRAPDARQAHTELEGPKKRPSTKGDGQVFTGRNRQKPIDYRHDPATFKSAPIDTETTDLAAAHDAT